MEPIELKSAEAFQKSVVGASHQQPVVALVGADWCRPCASLKPKLQEVCRNHSVPLVQFDGEALLELTKELMVRSVPTVMVFNRGKEILRFTGDKSIGDLELILMKAGVFQQPLL